MARGTRVISAGYTNEQLKRVLGGVAEKVEIACKKAISNREYLTTVAQQLVDHTAEYEPEFNDYTGNLVSSYSADVYIGNIGYAGTLYSKVHRGKIVPILNGRNIAYLLNKRHSALYKIKLSDKERISTRHNTEVTGKDPAKYRYLKPWEKQATGGYRTSPGHAKGSIAYDYGSAAIKEMRRDKYGKGEKYPARAYIILGNKAPYASYVQYGKNKRKHYNVLRGGYISRSLGGYTNLLKMITKVEIDKVLRLPMETELGYARKSSTAARIRFGI